MRRHEQYATPQLDFELSPAVVPLLYLIHSIYPLYVRHLISLRMRLFDTIGSSIPLPSCSIFLFALFTPSFRHLLMSISSLFYPVRMLTTEPLTLTDDKILIEMGSAREGQTEEEKETYLDGLKAIINDLRRDKVKDFNTVASEIAAYRRRFLQDPSRVLLL